MEGIVVIAVIALLAAPVLMLAALAKLGSISSELEDLKRMVGGLGVGGRTLDERRKTRGRTLDGRH